MPTSLADTHSENMTDFGEQSIPIAEKPGRVDAIFDSVASRYDLMNDLMSVGLHRLWKTMTLLISQIKPGDKVLDIASGTGDLAYRLAKRVGTAGHVVLLDRNRSMLQVARDRLINVGITTLPIIQGDAETLPFSDNTFDHITIGFGLRNFTRKTEALSSILRVLKPGGQLLILEFSKPQLSIVKYVYSLWSKHGIPRLGEWIAQDKASYQYLVESIQKHPNAEALKQIIVEAGFDRCRFYRLSGGIVALHQAWKA